MHISGENEVFLISVCGVGTVYETERHLLCMDREDDVCVCVSQVCDEIDCDV